MFFQSRAILSKWPNLRYQLPKPLTTEHLTPQLESAPIIRLIQLILLSSPYFPLRAGITGLRLRICFYFL